MGAAPAPLQPVAGPGCSAPSAGVDSYMRRWFGTAFVLGLVAACNGGGRLPAAPPKEVKGAERHVSAAQTPARAAAPPPTAASATSAEAPARAAAAPSLKSPRWTTLDDSDTCIELDPKAHSDFSTFPTQPACEAWVKSRHCRPGFHCFDGCNWRSCDDSGSAIEQTLAACSPRLVQFLFEPGQSKPGPSTNWPAIVDLISARLRAPQRQLKLQGYAGVDEAKSMPEVERLARTRSSAVARELAQRGISRQRLVIEVSSAAEIQRSNFEQPARYVMVSLLPEEPLRDDFAPGSREYRSFCGARPRD